MPPRNLHRLPPHEGDVKREKGRKCEKLIASLSGFVAELCFDVRQLVTTSEGDENVNKSFSRPSPRGDYAPDTFVASPGSTGSSFAHKQFFINKKL